MMGQQIAGKETAPPVVDILERLRSQTSANNPDFHAAVVNTLRLPPESPASEAQSKFQQLCKFIVGSTDARKIAIASARIHAIARAAIAAENGGATAQQALLELLTEPLIVNRKADAPPRVQHPPLEVDALFRLCTKLRGSDLHLQVGEPPLIRLGHRLVRQTALPTMSHTAMERVWNDFAEVIGPKEKADLKVKSGADFKHVVDGIRYRVNLCLADSYPTLSARRVNDVVLSLEDLGLPASLAKLCNLNQGFVLFAGPTGSGKSTSIAAMLNQINHDEEVKILTLEEPIESMFTNDKAMIVQREIFNDVDSWETALAQSLRQDPDVVLVGEMRDQMTFRAGIQVASTGHLAFGTIHASSAGGTITRVLDLFDPPDRQGVRQNLALNLKAVICQMLVPGPDGKKHAATEILLISPTAQRLILEGKENQLHDLIAAGAAEGMMTFNESLKGLANSGRITKETALSYSPNSEQLRMLLRGITTSTSGLVG